MNAMRTTPAHMLLFGIVSAALGAVTSCATLRDVEPQTVLDHSDEICVLVPPEDQELCGQAADLAVLVVAIADELRERRATELRAEPPAPSSSAPPTVSAAPRAPSVPSTAISAE